MFKPASHPVFPHLIYLKDVKFKGWGSDGKDKSTRLYRLDWEGLDIFKQQQHAEWNKKYWPNTIVSINFRLDPYYEDLLQSLRFAIPNHYLEEIHEQTQNAVTEWAKERRFDTVIREDCLKPAIEHAKVAFELVCDCVFDEKTNYYLRADNKYILAHLLLYRFWMGQTGRGCVQEHAGFPYLEERLKWLNDDATKLYEAAAIDRLFNAIKTYETGLDGCYSKIQAELCPSTDKPQPVKGEKAGGKNPKVSRNPVKPVFL
jgi:hypothetical protein